MSDEALDVWANNMQLEAEIDALRAENARLRVLLTDCASELADEINARYGDAKHIHRHRYDRDMQTVRAARAEMGESDEKATV